MINHLNRIYKLGYDIEVVWNKQIQITYDFNRIFVFDEYDPTIALLQNDARVLLYVHDYWEESLDFQKSLEETCNIFYSWYSDNNKLVLEYLKEYLREPLSQRINIILNRNSEDKFRLRIHELSLGDVTPQVTRHLRIDDILDDY